MALIGSLLHFLWMAISIIPVGIIMGAGRLFLSEPTRYRVGSWWCQSCVHTLRFFCGVKWEVTGRENIPTAPHARIMVLCKHQSAWETFAMSWLLGRDVVFVFKKELLRIPFFGWALGGVDMIHIDRSARAQAMQAVIEQSARLIDGGRWVIMFPEGTRTPRGQTVNYKSGGARTAIAAHADILPVALSSGKCWSKDSFIKRRGTIHVAIGPVITSEGKQYNALIKEAQAWIEGQMRIIDPQAYEKSSPPTNPSEVE